MAGVEELAPGAMQGLAPKPSCMHSSCMGADDSRREIPVSVRDEGCYAQLMTIVARGLALHR